MQLIEGACPAWENGWIEPRIAFADDGTATVVLRGTFPKNCRARTEVNVLDRVLYADRLFRALWHAGGGHGGGNGGSNGGKYHGATRDTADGVAAGARLLAEHRARPLAEIVRDVNKRSDNTFTRMVFLTLGETVAAGANGVPGAPLSTAPTQSAVTPLAASPARESSFAKSDRVVRAWFSRHGIDPAGIVLDNGSGLSRSERISAAQMAGLLKVAQQSNWAPEFLASLPLVGLDGTMRNRLRQSPVTGRARIKTGTLRDVVAVAGYVPSATGEPLIAVMMVNHANATSSNARPVVDAFIEWVGGQ
jgi:serine-type D-Ala-D-Ala carboxypeptidase/endopeptidase (penicillin-binding protein 4)